MKRFLLLALFLKISCTFAQFPVIKKVDGKFIDAASLTKKIKAIVDSAKISGMQVAISNDNKVIYSQSFGLRNIAANLPLNDQTVMYAASLTKPVSGYLFALLVERGIFNLDKPLYTYLKKPIGSYPKWKDLEKDSLQFKKITARMLLSHSAGLPVMRQVYGNELRIIAKPGERFYYSNEGMNLIGFVIEEYVGKPLETLSRELVFDPLHMERTSMIWERSFENNHSLGYLANGALFGVMKKDSLNARAAGSMSTTALDYSRFLNHLMRNAKKNEVKEMLTPQFFVKSKRGFGPLRDTLTSDNDAVKLAWGLGIGTFDTIYGKAYFHTGHGDANQNLSLAFPDKGISIVLLSNSNNFEKQGKKLLELCLGETFTPFNWLGYGEEKL